METISMSKAAKALNVSRQAIWQAVQRGTIPAVKLNDQWQVDKQAVIDRQDHKPVGGRPPFEPGAGYLSVSQAAVWFGVATSTVYRWVNVGMIPAERKDDSILIPVDAALSFQRPARGRPTGGA